MLFYIQTGIYIIYTHICMYMYVFVYIFVSMYICIHVCIYIYMYEHESNDEYEPDLVFIVVIWYLI